jgi:class 3 adenylate cyclase
MLGFSAAGVSIIDAARLQTACAEDGILIDSATWHALSPDDQRSFAVRKPVRPKKHEDRSISAWQWPGARPKPTLGRFVLRVLALIAVAGAVAAALYLWRHP